MKRTWVRFAASIILASVAINLSDFSLREFVVIVLLIISQNEWHEGLNHPNPK